MRKNRNQHSKTFIETIKDFFVGETRSRYNLSLYILIPAIFSGMSILTGIIAFQFSRYYAKGVKLSGEIALWVIVIIGVTFLCGFLITRLILSPMRKFVKEAEKTAVF